jgi:hypothetical protein
LVEVIKNIATLNCKKEFKKEKICKLWRKKEGKEMAQKAIDFTPP